jgi:GntR family L-lactate dehydrogenase operon transcriptional regulator
LDRQGYTRKVGRSGRLLTDQGRERIQALRRRTYVKAQTSALVEVLTGDTRDNMIEVLEARMLLESEIAAAAARKVTAADLEAAEAILAAQQAAIALGGTGQQANLAFHDFLVEVSGKRVLGQALKLIRHESASPLTTDDIRGQVGSRYVAEHRQIMAALRSGSPERARTAMAAHIQSLIQDVKDYWATLSVD